VQYNYLLSNPKIDAVGSYANIINKYGVFDFNYMKEEVIIKQNLI
jgi:hypothetical protein